MEKLSSIRGLYGFGKLEVLNLNHLLKKTPHLLSACCLSIAQHKTTGHAC